jgi:hypothetical protein
MLKLGARFMYDRERKRDRERQSNKKEYFLSRTAANYTLYAPLSPFLLAEMFLVHILYSEGLG